MVDLRVTFWRRGGYSCGPMAAGIWLGDAARWNVQRVRPVSPRRPGRWVSRRQRWVSWRGFGYRARTGTSRRFHAGVAGRPNGVLSTADALFNATGLNWTMLSGQGKNDPNDEEGWTLLPNGRILTVDTWLTLRPRCSLRVPA
jgi:hypothetical protein